MLALTWYDWFLAGHVLSSVLWVGGAFTMGALGFVIERERNPAALAQFGRQAGLVGARVFTPLSILVFLFGVGLMENGQSPWEWDMTWITVSVVLWLVAFLVGSVYLRARAGTLRRIIQAEGPGGADAQAMIRSLLIVSRLNTVLLLVIVVLMAVKPWM